MKTVSRIGFACVLACAAMTYLAFAQEGKEAKEAKEGPMTRAATKASMGTAPAPAADAAASPFDKAATFVPAHELKLNHRAMGTDAAALGAAEQGVSITSDGKVEKLPLPKGMDAAFRDMLNKIDVPEAGKTGDAEPLIGIDSVIGEDTRVRITNTTAYPYRTAGRIDLGCTGTLIGPRHVLTAGHCVYNVNTNQWYSNLNFSPGQNGNSKPYGTVTWKRAIAVEGYTKDHDSNYDYALIVLNQDIGTTTGTMSFGYDDALPLYKVNINGYSGDKPTGTLWHSFGAIKQVSPLHFKHDCDTFNGNSGSGVYVYKAAANSRVIYGVHVHGVDGSGHNGATRINKVRFDNLNRWMAEN